MNSFSTRLDRYGKPNVALTFNSKELEAVRFACYVNRDIIQQRIESGEYFPGDKAEVRRLNSILNRIAKMQNGGA